MKKSFILYIAATAVCCIMTAGCAGNKSTAPEFDYEALNAQALAEYLQPVHPGERGGTPFWNKFSTKYIYAPVFDLDDVENAKGYTYTAEAGGQFFVFDSDSPRTPLSDIWTELPVGPVKLSVQAYDSQGGLLGEPQSRSFEKDNPFCGPYDPAPGSYRGAAIKAAEFVHTSDIAQSWASGSADPDMKYQYNCYACKIWSAIVQSECFLARKKPEYKDDALRIARTVADALISHSQPGDATLAYFPPTYYYAREGDGIVRVLDFNRGNTMFLEAVYAARAYLDLYDTIGEEKYLEAARRIADTYKKVQAKDGSWPVKVNYTTGEPVVEARCMPGNILSLAGRLKEQYGIGGYEQMIAAGEKWMWDNTIANFNFNGQFEDVSVGDKSDYQNLTHCVAGDCIDYLLSKKNPSQKEIDACWEMARFAEDQFTRWHSSVEKDADALSATENTVSYPFAFEQYSWKSPVDASVAKVANNWIHLYEKTSDMLALAKAKALVDSLVKMQDPESGCVPTVPNWEHCYLPNETWANCEYYSIGTLMRMADILGE
ncbi:MAG: hypothetical protein IJS70_02675 [Bacteroidales bacterium]|nr:hypothetical protein [Bacteroidales bacterium]